MNVPKLRFKEFDGELIEDIIQNYAEVQTGPFGSQLHEKDYVKVGTPIITVEHFGDNRIIHKNLPMVSNEDKERLKKYSLKEGDVVFSRVGSIDRRVYVTEREDGWLFSGRCLRLRIINTNLSSKYLSTYLGTTKCLNEIRSKAVGGTMPSLNTDILNSISINLPQYKEQEKVASFFEKLDKQIQLQQQKIDLLQEQKKGFLQKMFPKAGETQPEMRCKGFAGDWEENKCSEIFNIITDYVANGSFAALKENVSYSAKKDYAIIVRLTDYNNNYEGPFLYTSKSGYDFLKKSSLKADDILISNVGAHAGLVYKAPKINIPMTLGPNSILVRTNDSNDREFMYQLMKNSIGQNLIKNQIGTSAQPKFNKTEFKQIKFIIPEKSEQQAISKFFKKLDDIIKLQKNKLELLKKQKQGFMQQMFI